jgi:hypothetical protein
MLGWREDPPQITENHRRTKKEKKAIFGFYPGIFAIY